MSILNYPDVLAELKKTIRDAREAATAKNVGKTRGQPGYVPVPFPEDHETNVKRCEALANAACFLQAEDSRMESALMRLNNLMEDEIQGTPERAFDRGNAGRSHHALTNVLAWFEREEGFEGMVKDQSRDISPVILGKLDNESFAATIRGGFLAKDKIGGVHGKYSHRIQWFCIGRNKSQLAPGYGRLADLFKVSGLLWTKVFDRDPTSTPDSDFRAPESLMKFIDATFLSRDTRWPYLGAFLHSKAQNSEIGRFHYQLYYIKQKYRTAWQSLNLKSISLMTASEAQQALNNLENPPKNDPWPAILDDMKKAFKVSLGQVNSEKFRRIMTASGTSLIQR